MKDKIYLIIVCIVVFIYTFCCYLFPIIFDSYSGKKGVCVEVYMLFIKNYIHSV